MMVLFIRLVFLFVEISES